MITNPEQRSIALARPFAADRVEWRIQSSGLKKDGSPWAKVLCYITQRAAFERLDEVFGESWSMSESFYEVAGRAVCVCKVEVALAGEPVRIVTGTCEVDFNKAGEIDPFKTAASGALKRAVVSLKIGRYLYDLPEAWADISERGEYQGVVKPKDGPRVYFKWNPPALPSWALPSAGATAAEIPAKVAWSAPAEDIEIPAYEEPEIEQASAPAAPIAPAAPRASAPAARSPQALEEDPFIPFGRNKGSRLSEVAKADLEYFANKWQPKPWEKTGKVSDKDANLKARAQARLAALEAGQVQDKPYPNLPPTDEVPF